jgi:hypothetical protein
MKVLCITLTRHLTVAVVHSYHVLVCNNKCWCVYQECMTGGKAFTSMTLQEGRSTAVLFAEPAADKLPKGIKVCMETLQPTTLLRCEQYYHTLTLPMQLW